MIRRIFLLCMDNAFLLKIDRCTIANNSAQHLSGFGVSLNTIVERVKLARLSVRMQFHRSEPTWVCGFNWLTPICYQYVIAQEPRPGEKVESSRKSSF